MIKLFFESYIGTFQFPSLFNVAVPTLKLSLSIVVFAMFSMSLAVSVWSLTVTVFEIEHSLYVEVIIYDPGYKLIFNLATPVLSVVR